MSPRFLFATMVLGLMSCSEEVDQKKSDVSDTPEKTENSENYFERKTHRQLVEFPQIESSDYYQCDSVYIATYPGNACCVSGATVARPGDSLVYHYQMKHPYPKVSWQVWKGDISIVAGQGTQNCVMKFGPNFTSGKIVAVGASKVALEYEVGTTELKCGDRLEVFNPDSLAISVSERSGN